MLSRCTGQTVGQRAALGRFCEVQPCKAHSELQIAAQQMVSTRNSITLRCTLCSTCPKAPAQPLNIVMSTELSYDTAADLSHRKLDCYAIR